MKHFVLLLSLLVFMAACKKEEAPAGGSTATADSTKEATRAKFLEVYDAFNTGNFDKLDAHIAADFVEHTPFPGMEPGLAGLKKAFANFRTAFPDVKFTLNDFWMDGDIAIAHLTQTGTNTGPMMGMPPTGKSMNIKGVDIIRMKDGKAVEHWGYQEDMKMAQQLGWMPAPDQGGAAPPAGGGDGGGSKKEPSGTPKSEPPTGKPKY